MDDFIYRGSMRCFYCGYSDSMMLEPLLMSSDSDDRTCEGGGGCLCNQCVWPPRSPTTARTRVNSTSLVHLQVRGIPHLPAPPPTRTIYPVLKVHPLWLQMELMRLFPETVDFRAGDAGLSDRENQCRPELDNPFYPWSRPRDDMRNIRPWDGPSPPSPFGAIGHPVPQGARRDTSLVLSPSTNEDSLWTPMMSPFPSSRSSDVTAASRAPTPQFILPTSEETGGYRFVNESFPPLGGSRKTSEDTETPEPPEVSSTFSSDSDGDLAVKSSNWGRRYPPKPPRFATKKKLRHCRSSTS